MDEHPDLSIDPWTTALVGTSSVVVSCVGREMGPF